VDHLVCFEGPGSGVKQAVLDIDDEKSSFHGGLGK